MNGKETTVRTTKMQGICAAAALCAGLAYAGDTLPARQNQPSPYRLTLLASLGGTNSRGSGVNNGQWVTGYSTLAGEQARHAVLWLYGTAIDLGTLGGANSSINWPVKNNVGLIAGISQTSTPDPLADMNADLASDAFIEPDLNVGNDDVDTVGGVFTASVPHPDRPNPPTKVTAAKQIGTTKRLHMGF